MGPLGSDYVSRVGLLWIALVLVQKKSQRASSHLLWWRRHNKKMVTDEPESELSLHSESISDLILDFPFSRIVKNRSVLFIATQSMASCLSRQKECGCPLCWNFSINQAVSPTLAFCHLSNTLLLTISKSNCSYFIWICFYKNDTCSLFLKSNRKVLRRKISPSPIIINITQTFPNISLGICSK